MNLDDKFMSFKISDKVICLSDIEKNLDERFKIFHTTYPEKGQIYVIRGILDFGIENCPIKGLYLVGIESKNNTNGKEQSWSSFDFKLLKDVKNKKFDGEYDWLKNE